MKSKPRKKYDEAHSANAKFGMGDHYGSGIKQPVGKLRDTYIGSPHMTNKKIGKPPKSLA